MFTSRFVEKNVRIAIFISPPPLAATEHPCSN